MASRNFKNAHYSLEQDVVNLWLQVLIGASGAVTSFKGLGVLSVTKGSADGEYDIVLQDRYDKLLDYGISVVSSAIEDAGRGQILMTPANLLAAVKGGTAIKVQLLINDVVPDLEEGNLGSGAELLVKFELRNSSLGPA